MIGQYGLGFERKERLMKTRKSIYPTYFLKHLLSFLCFTILFILVNAPRYGYCGNTSVNSMAVRAQSMQSFTAVADDPSAVFYNPAGLVQVPGMQFENGIAIILPNQTYVNTYFDVETRQDRDAYAPNSHFTMDKYKPLYMGIGIYAPFARESRYDMNQAVYNTFHRAKLLRVDIAPTLAYEINPMLSVGAGLVVSHVRVTNDVLGFYERGNGYGVTGQGGVLLRFNDCLKFGLTYRGPMDADVDGSGHLGDIHDDFTTDVDFPDVWSIGTAIQVTPQLLLAASFDLERWSRVKYSRRHYNNPVLASLGYNELNGEDSKNFRIGAAYKRNKTQEFRAGYSHLTAGIPPNYAIPAQPDYQANFISIGMSQFVMKQLRLDAGYEYGFSASRYSQNEFFPGKYKARVHTILLGGVYYFA